MTRVSITRLTPSLCPVVLLVGLLLSAPAAAQTPAAAPASQAPPAADEDDYPVLLDGTLSGKGDQEDADRNRPGFLRFPTLFDPWFALKQEWRQKYGLTVGGSYGILWQNYSQSLLDQENAVGGKFTLNVGYELFRRGRPNATWLEVVVEDRRPVGTERPPLVAGALAGSISLTTATWGQFDLGVTQAYLRSNLFGNRFQYAVGKIFAPNFFHAYPFFDDNRQYFNQGFATLAPTPLRGFGGVAALYPIENSRFYIKSGMYTLNSDDTGITIDDFFTKAEHFYHLDLGFTGLARTPVPLQARGPMDANNINISGWYRNSQADGTPEAVGIAGNANYMVGSNHNVFLRGGWNNGSLFQGFVTGGFAWRPPAAPSDLFGAGFAWAHPANPPILPIQVPGLNNLRDQYTWEVFYRFHVTPNFALTPDFQLIVDPTLTPTENTMVALGLRARVTF